MLNGLLNGHLGPGGSYVWETLQGHVNILTSFNLEVYIKKQ